MDKRTALKLARIGRVIMMLEFWDKQHTSHNDLYGNKVSWLDLVTVGRTPISLYKNKILKVGGEK